MDTNCDLHIAEQTQVLFVFFPISNVSHVRIPSRSVCHEELKRPNHPCSKPVDNCSVPEGLRRPRCKLQIEARNFVTTPDLCLWAFLFLGEGECDRFESPSAQWLAGVSQKTADSTRRLVQATIDSPS